MRILPFTPDLQLSLTSAVSGLGRTSQFGSGTSALHALGGPKAVIAVVDTPNSSIAEEDDWSGSFDIHLGVHTND